MTDWHYYDFFLDTVSISILATRRRNAQATGQRAGRMGPSPVHTRQF